MFNYRYVDCILLSKPTGNTEHTLISIFVVVVVVVVVDV